VTYKVIHLLQASPRVIFCITVKQLVGKISTVTKRVARSLCDSWSSCYSFFYFSSSHEKQFTYVPAMSAKWIL